MEKDIPGDHFVVGLLKHVHVRVGNNVFLAFHWHSRVLARRNGNGRAASVQAMHHEHHLFCLRSPLYPLRDFRCGRKVPSLRSIVSIVVTKDDLVHAIPGNISPILDDGCVRKESFDIEQNGETARTS